MRTFITASLIALQSAAAMSAPIYDYSTPEKSLQSLERALTAKNIEVAVRSKAFRNEAKALLEERFKGKVTEEMIASVTRSLELSYRLEIKKNGFPDFSSLKCSATSEIINPVVAVLIERCVFPDRGHSIQKFKAYKVGSEWKIGEVLE